MMNNTLNIPTKKIVMFAIVSALGSASHVFAQPLLAPFSDTTVIQSQDVQFSEAELSQILAPIALYPDTLLTHILISATYPLEVIDADRFVKQHDSYNTDEINSLANNKDWDPSVKALLAFPRLLSNLSTDLGWMRKLGDAFLQNESAVLASIQILREKADEAGNLAQMDNVNVIREKRTIVIESARPEVVYVPYYDPRTVYGHWRWANYPPNYWHRPISYSYYHGPFYWHSGVHIAFDFFFTGFHWRDRYIVRYHDKKRRYHSRQKIATSHGAKRWHHNPSHRRGVAYRSKAIKHRYNSHRPAVVTSRNVRKAYKNNVATSRKVHNDNTKHRQVTKRLNVNKAVKITKHNKQVNTRKFVNKTRANKEKLVHGHSNQERKFLTAPGRNQRVQETKQIKKYSNNKPAFERDTWKVKNKVKKVEQTRSHKLVTRKKSYDSKGGHSNRSYSRVTKNSSGRTKVAANKRQKNH